MDENTQHTPRHFGGFGGLEETREVDQSDEFEVLIERTMGARIREDEEFGARLWGSLANVVWHHTNGDTASYTFRAAGDLIAAVVGSGNYMDWYMSGDYGVIDEDVAEILAEHGWTGEDD